MHLDACTEMCNDAYKCSDFAQKFQNMNSFVSLSRERFCVLTILELAVFLAFGLIESGQFWSLLPRSRALCTTMLLSGTQFLALLVSRR